MKKLILVLSLILIVSGCAFSPDEMTAGYFPQQNVESVIGADKINVEVEVADNRIIKDKVSAKKNGYGMECASIIAKNDVGQTVEDAIKTELSNRGFKITKPGSFVDIKLQNYYSDFKLGFFSGDAIAEVRFDVKVLDKGKKMVFSDSIVGNYTHGGVQVCSGKNAKAALDGALKEAVSKLMRNQDFISALLKQ